MVLVLRSIHKNILKRCCMSDLVPSLRDSVLDPSVDFIEEICEIGIDSMRFILGSKM